MSKEFLKEILGVEGSAALDGVVNRAPLFKSVIVPRAVLSWVSTIGGLGFEGELPGVPDSYFSLNKNEDGSYTGALTVQEYLYTFENADSTHVASSVGVALGIELEPLDEKLKTKDLSSLGKSIDLLVKSEIINKNKKKKKLAKKDGDTSTAGPPAPPQKAMEPAKPIAPQKQGNAKAPAQPENLALGFAKFKVTKAEMMKKCQECNNVQFKGDRFVGCACLLELSKSVVSERVGDELILKVDRSIGEDAISTLLAVLKD